MAKRSSRRKLKICEGELDGNIREASEGDNTIGDSRDDNDNGIVGDRDSISDTISDGLLKAVIFLRGKNE